MPNTNFKLSRSNNIGDNQPVLIIAEVAQAHDGSLGLAHAYIDAVAQCGVDAVKFQTHIAEAESTHEEPWRIKFSYQDKSRYDYWKRMEFGLEQWIQLKRHANEQGLHFISSPFSIEAVKLLTKVGVPAWKIASGEFNNSPLLKSIAKSKLPVLISTGMSSMDEIDEIVEYFKSENTAFAILQCTSSYPTPPEKVGLNMLNVFRERYGCQVGLSDHSGSIYACIAAATLGAEILEVHVALSREIHGPDVTSSITTTELKQLVEGVRFVEKINSNPVDKDVISEQLSELRNTFTKSIVSAKALKAGTVLRLSDLAFKKPGFGIAPDKFADFVGKKLVNHIKKDQILQYSDVE